MAKELSSRRRKSPPFKAMSVGFIAVCVALMIYIPFMQDAKPGMQIMIMAFLALIICVMGYNIKIVNRNKREAEAEKEKTGEVKEE